MTKARFLDTLRAERARWDATLAQIDEGRSTGRGVAGEGSVQELVAHVAWSEREMVGVARAHALVGSDLWNLGQDDRNRIVIEQARDRPLHTVLADAQETYRQLLAALETLAEEDFHDPRRFREMPATW